MDKFTSIIFVHYGMSEERSETMLKSINSLVENTDSPYELIVVDNGEKIEDSYFFLDLISAGKITTYIRNHHNMHFAYARNQALELCQGDYIAIVDNDILYEKGWLSKCVNILEAFPDKKWYATPLDYPKEGFPGVFRYRVETFEYEGEEYSLNMRAGSNCMVIRRKHLKHIGKFLIHRIAGTKWTDRAARLGYHACVVPGNLVKDMGFRKGYRLNEAKPIFLDIFNQGKVYFNQDEFGSDIQRFQQKTFNS